MLFKAFFLHPTTRVPLIACFNKETGLLYFEKDDEMVTFLLSMKESLEDGEILEENVAKASNILQAVYPVDTVDEVFEFLEKIGVERKRVLVRTSYLH